MLKIFFFNVPRFISKLRVHQRHFQRDGQNLLYCYIKDNNLVSISVTEKELFESIDVFMSFCFPKIFRCLLVFHYQIFAQIDINYYQTWSSRNARLISYPNQAGYFLIHHRIDS